MNKKLLGIIIIVAGVLLVVGFLYFMFFSNPTPEEVVNETEQPQETPGLPTEQPVVEQPGRRVVVDVGRRVETEEMTEGDLRRVAASFAERFGSYSNQSNYGNIHDLKIFMSSKMKKWADNYIKEEIAKNTDSSIYVGMTTKAVSEKVTQFDNDTGRAVIVVSTRRRMSTGTMTNAVTTQQDVILYFVKEQRVWKVDDAVWQENL